MLIFPNALFGRPAKSRPTGAVALDLDFAAGSYRAGEATHPSLAALPGYAFARDGEQGAADGSGAVDWFPANAPAINGLGFHAFGAGTNHLPNSQSLGSLALLGAGTGSAPLRTLDQGIAPDGSAGASRFQFNRGSGATGSDYSVATLLSTATVASGEAWTESVWARAVNGTQTVTLYFGGGNFAFQPMPFTLTTSWRRLAISQVALSTGSGANFGIGLIGNDGSGAQSADILAWQGQFVPGGFADGGPLIRTASSSAAIGEARLSLALDNGSYLATFTFDDGTSQTMPVMIGDGQFNHPTLGALDRAIVKRTVVKVA